MNRASAAREREHERATPPEPSRMYRLVDWVSTHLLLRTVPRWLQSAVVLVMLCLVVVVESISAHTRETSFHPAPLLLAGVEFATLVGGPAPGLVCAVIAVSYELSFALTRGEDARYTIGSVIVLLIIAPTTAMAIGALRSYAERAGRDRERLTEQQAELLARELALRDTNRRMDVFVSMVTHELKAPLTSLKGTLQLAVRRQSRGISSPVATGEAPAEAPDERMLLDLLRRADQQVNRLTRLVDDLLDLSRAQADKLVIREAPCDLVDVVREVVSDERSAWPARTITFAEPPGPIEVSVDRDRIAQVVTNYLTNALKYSGDESPVEVCVYVEAVTARVAVRDHGSGLTVEEQARVWERFHQVAGSEGLAMTSGGLGLGLFISRTIIQRHRGEVGVETTPGGGATFWFAVPLRTRA